MNGLVCAAVYEFKGSVGGEKDKRNMGHGGFYHCGQEIGDSAAGSAYDGYSVTGSFRDSERVKGERAFVEMNDGL